MKIKINPGLEHVTDRSDLLRDFVIFVCKDLRCMPCDIDIVNGRDGSGLKTTAQYDPNNHHVMVNAKNRHFGDVLRSIAHELVHHKQNVNGEFSGPVQDVGGDIEDEANARAGALLKSFAYQEGPERIYESRHHRALHEDAKEQLERGLTNFNKKIPVVLRPAGEAMTSLLGKSAIDKARDAAEEFAGDVRDTVTAKARAALDYAKRKGYKLRKAGAPQERFRDSKINRSQAIKILKGHPLDLWTKTVFIPVPFRGAPTRSTFNGNKSLEFPGQAAPVHASAEGVVQEIGNKDGMGNYVKIIHWRKPKDKEEKSSLLRTSYYFMGRLLDNIRPGSMVQQGEMIGYTNSLLDPEIDRDENRNFEFTFEQLATKEPGTDKWTQDHRFIDALSAGPLREQVEDSLRDLKRSFVQNVFKVVSPLKSMNVTSAAGKRNLTGTVEKHGGIDYKAAVGTPVRNPMLSVVRAINTGEDQYDARKFKGSDLTGKQRSGNYVTIEPVFQWPDGKKRRFSFTHLDQVDVRPGQVLLPGDILGTTGNTGRTTGPHLHLTPKKSGARGDIYLSFDEVEEDVERLQAQFMGVVDDDSRFLALFSNSIPQEYSGLAENSDRKLVQTYINELITSYGVGRIDPTQGGVGKMFKLGVDYKNASTNIPHVGQGYVDRSHALPYEITLSTNLDAKEMFNTLFGEDFCTDYILIVPDQVSYTKDGFRLSASVSTGSNQGDEDDVNRISTALYKAVQGFPSTPKDANFVIDVKPVADKIKYFV
jgi:murein DD-endopeptidase MepM/ murein hydrolase activator NlpD